MLVDSRFPCPPTCLWAHPSALGSHWCPQAWGTQEPPILAAVGWESPVHMPPSPGTLGIQGLPCAGPAPPFLRAELCPLLSSPFSGVELKSPLLTNPASVYPTAMENEVIDCTPILWSTEKETLGTRDSSCHLGQVPSLAPVGTQLAPSCTSWHPAYFPAASASHGGARGGLHPNLQE